MAVLIPLGNYHECRTIVVDKKVLKHRLFGVTVQRLRIKVRRPKSGSLFALHQS
jgi:hypothetical protein